MFKSSEVRWEGEFPGSPEQLWEGFTKHAGDYRPDGSHLTSVQHGSLEASAFDGAPDEPAWRELLIDKVVA